MYIKKTIFKKYWEILRKNKMDLKHNTTEDFMLYYSIFKDETDEVFIEAIKLILKELSYFPRVDEMNTFINKAKQELNLKKFDNSSEEEFTEEDKEWYRGFYKKYCDTEEEYHKKLIKNGL